MKRILSVILSLALLASALIIPMSVSAEGTLTAEEAYAQLNAAVDGLVLDLDAAHQNGLLTETARPVGSQINANNGEDDVNTDEEEDKISINDTEAALVSKIGSKSVSVTGNVANTGGWGLNTNDLHALRYQYSSKIGDTDGYFRLKEIGYIVLYVKTNRAFKLGMSVHNNSATPRIVAGRNVPATGSDYEPIIINMTKIDWTTQWDFKKAYMGKSVNWGFFPAIESFTDENQTITSADGIVFGSLFCVPVDTAVRDFKYDLTGTYPDYPTKKYETLSADMILAAELIKNDDGRYTAESFAALQEAIKNAKVTLINDGTNDVNDALELFKAEVANLYKLEEVFRPKFVGSNTAREKATDEDVKNLSDYQKSLLGEHYIKIESSDLNKDINFVDVSATGQYPDSPVKDYTKYRNIYLYVVNNTGSVYYAPTFNAYIGGDGNSSISFYDNNLYANSRRNTFILNTTVTRCDLFDLNVNAVGPAGNENVYHNNDVRYFVKNYTFDNGDGSTKTYYEKYKGSSRIQWKIPTGDLSGTSNLILGSMMGEIAFDTTDDKDLKLLNSIEGIFGYYSKYIAGQGYINTDDIESTLSAMGAISIPVTGFYEKYATIEFTGNYSFAAALQNAEVTFKVNPQEGATVKEVIYGGEKQTVGADGVYTITADANTTLKINLNPVTTEFGNDDVSKYFETDTTNIALGKTPHVFLTNRTGESAERTLITGDKISNLSNDDYTTDSAADVSLGINFCTDASKNEFLNGYVPYKADVGDDFDFEDNSTYTYVDIIYDLGTTADIYKVQQMSYRNDGLQLGLYEVYASEDINDLFNRTKSLVVSYQNKTAQTGSTKTGNEQHEFPTRSARFVAFRVYSATTYSTAHSNTLRTRELAIYGTQTGAYKVTEIPIPTDSNPVNIDANSLLNSDTLISIKGYENDVEIGNIPIDKNNTNQQKLHSGTYQKNGYGDFNTAVFYDTNNSKFKNGFVIDRTGIDGNINFRDQDAETTIHSDFTYDLGSYYKIDRFELYSSTDLWNKLLTQSYEVYIGNDLATLYKGTPVAVYNNYYNTFAQSIKFAESQIGKYLGVRILMPADRMDGANYVRLDELAAYGEEVDAPDDENLKADITSKSGYIYNKNGSSVYPGTGETQRTALRLTVGYKSPKVPGGANASKIVLANGDTADVIERNVIAIAKSKYNSDQDFNIHTEGASVTVSTATSTDYPVSNYFKSEEIKETDGSVNQEYRMAYGALNLNNISETNKDSQIVVRGRVVYKYDGKIYAVYSNIVGVNEIVSAQAAYNQLKDPSQGWFE